MDSRVGDRLRYVTTVAKQVFPNLGTLSLTLVGPFLAERDLAKECDTCWNFPGRNSLTAVIGNWPLQLILLGDAGMGLRVEEGLGETMMSAKMAVPALLEPALVEGLQTFPGNSYLCGPAEREENPCGWLEYSWYDPS